MERRHSPLNEPLLIGLINQGRKTFCPDSMRRTLDIDIDLASNERRGREVERRRGKVKVEFDIMELNLIYFIYILILCNERMSSTLR